MPAIRRHLAFSIVSPHERLTYQRVSFPVRRAQAEKLVLFLDLEDGSTILGTKGFLDERLGRKFGVDIGEIHAGVRTDVGNKFVNDYVGGVSRVCVFEGRDLVAIWAADGEMHPRPVLVGLRKNVTLGLVGFAVFVVPED